jgi:hypothetical protein
MAPDTLLTIRAAVVLLLALLIGVLAGWLAYLKSQSVPGAMLVGGGAAAGAVIFFNQLIA